MGISKEDEEGLRTGIINNLPEAKTTRKDKRNRSKITLRFKRYCREAFGCTWENDLSYTARAFSIHHNLPIPEGQRGCAWFWQHHALIMPFIEKSGLNLEKRKKGDVSQRKKDYREYLQSPEWQAIRLDLFQTRGKKCELCGSTSNIQIHHLTYKNIFKEEPEDLQVVCRGCHEKIHGHKKTDKEEGQSEMYKQVLKIISTKGQSPKVKTRRVMAIFTNSKKT